MNIVTLWVCLRISSRHLWRTSAQEEDLTISKNERLLIKKLAWVWDSEKDVCQAFKQRVRSGEIRTITKAKDEAAKVWKTHSSLSIS